MQRALKWLLGTWWSSQKGELAEGKPKSHTEQVWGLAVDADTTSNGVLQIMYIQEW